MPIVIEKPNLKVSKSQSDIMEDYKPFKTKGFVWLIGDETSLQSVKILRDTGASQSLMLYTPRQKLRNTYIILLIFFCFEIKFVVFLLPYYSFIYS